MTPAQRKSPENMERLRKAREKARVVKADPAWIAEYKGLEAFRIARAVRARRAKERQQ